MKKTKHLEAVIEERGAVIEERDNLIVYLRSEIENLNKQLADKCRLERLCGELKQRSKILDEILSYRDVLEKVTLCLDGTTDSSDTSDIGDIDLCQVNNETCLDENSNIVDADTNISDAETRI